MSQFFVYVNRVTVSNVFWDGMYMTKTTEKKPPFKSPTKKTVASNKTTAAKTKKKAEPKSADTKERKESSKPAPAKEKAAAKPSRPAKPKSEKAVETKPSVAKAKGTTATKSSKPVSQPAAKPKAAASKRTTEKVTEASLTETKQQKSSEQRNQPKTTEKNHPVVNHTATREPQKPAIAQVITNAAAESEPAPEPKSVTATDENKPIVSDEDAAIARELEQKATFLLDLGFQQAVALNLAKRDFVQPERIPPSLWETALRGACTLVTGDAGPESRILWMSVIASRINHLRISRGEPQSPSVIVVTGGDRSATAALQQAKEFFAPFDIKVFGIFRDTDAKRSERPLAAGPDIVIVSREALTQIKTTHNVSLDQVQAVVCEDFERVVEYKEGGADFEKILAFLQGHDCQHLYFAGRQSQPIRDHLLLDSKEVISVDLAAQAWCRKKPERQWLYAMQAVEKFNVLQGVLRDNKGKCALVFANTGAVVLWLAYKLVRNDFRVDFLTSMPKPDRARRLASRIQKGELDVVVCSDSVAHAISVAASPAIVNFDVPTIPFNYAARAGTFPHTNNETNIITFVCEDYGFNMSKLSEYLEFVPETREIPKSYAEIEDKSDSPFDSQGRFKPVWPESSDRPVTDDEVEPAPRPRPAAPHRPRAEGEEISFTATTAVASDRRPRHAPVAPAVTAATPMAASAAHVDEEPTTTTTPIMTTASTTTTTTYEGHRQPRRDERAREVIEKTLDAARSRQRGHTAPPQEEMDLQEVSLLEVAREGLEAAMAAFQATVAPTVRTRFPRVSGLLERLGFFGDGREDE